MIFYIGSAMNPLPRIPSSRCKSYQKLTQKKYRESERKFIIEGVHLVEEILNTAWDVETILVSETFLQSREFPPLQKKAHAKKIPFFLTSDREIRTLSDAVTTQGIVAIVREKEIAELWDQLSVKSLIVMLDGISDPGNVGTLIRTCDWFGIDAVIVGNASVELYNPKVLRSTMGSMFHLPVIIDDHLSQTVEKLKRHHWRIVSTVVTGGTNLSQKFAVGKYCFVFGNESHGVSKEIRSLADVSVTIPKFGQAESLNVAVSCGVILSHLTL
jgi:RNA methyltransferase, TrmH family